MVERKVEALGVGGSIPSTSTNMKGRKMSYNSNILGAYFMLVESRASDMDILQLNLPVELGGEPIDINTYSHRGELFIAGFEYLRDHLRVDMTRDEINTTVYDAGKASYGKEQLRSWFRDFYYVLFQRSEGCRIEQFIQLWGVDRFLDRVDERLMSPFTT